MRRGYSRFISALIIGIACLWLWDTIRPEASFWTLGAANINPGRLMSSPAEWLPRLEDWLNHSQKLLSVPLLNWVLIALAGYAGFRRRSRYDVWLFLMALGYFLFHWLNAYPTFDRYMLPLVPLLGILAARSIPERYAIIAGIVLLIGVFSTYDARQDGFHSGNPDGLLNLAAWIDSKPLGTIIYNPCMGWEMGYYRGAWSDKRWVHYPNADIQAQDALLNPDPAPRYFLIPAGNNPQPWITALMDVGFAAELVYAQDNFYVYELTPPWADASAVESSCAAQALDCG